MSRQTQLNCSRIDQTGFTLIEVLIALTLLSIMVVLLFTSLRICAKSWEQGESKITEVNEVAVVYNFFQRYLGSAIPLWDDFNKTGRKKRTDPATLDDKRLLSFQGTQHALQFVSFFPASAGRAGMQQFTIQSEDQGNEQLIKVTLTPFFPTAEGEEWSKEEVVLLKHVKRFALSYFGVADQSGESRWLDEWQEKTAQPQLVKISLDTLNNVFWPDIIVELKASDPGGTQQATVIK